MVLDCVVSSTIQHLRNFSPAISKTHVAFDDDSVFLYCPCLRFVDAWIQVIVPSLSALLSASPFDVVRDGAPFFGT